MPPRSAADPDLFAQTSPGPRSARRHGRARGGGLAAGFGEGVTATRTGASPGANRSLVIGVASWRLTLPECRSLKEKRMILRSLKDRIAHRFNVSIAETADQDVWTRGELTVAVVAANRALADSTLDHVDQFLVRDGRAVIEETSRQLL